MGFYWEKVLQNGTRERLCALSQTVGGSSHNNCTENVMSSDLGSYICYATNTRGK
uniref:Ig-like domain-containing protein n=1 Tax=Ciona intestinalis TaxID=7719 RepID=F6YU22_CIOIN